MRRRKRRRRRKKKRRKRVSSKLEGEVVDDILRGKRG